MRKPRVKNKYNLIPKDITRAIILDEKKLHQEPFWRNDVIQAWVLSGGVGKDPFGDYDNSYWIGFYDEDASAYAGKIRLKCSSYSGMCNYSFTKFYNPYEIQNEVDLELQEELLEKINWMIDEKIITIKRRR